MLVPSFNDINFILPKAGLKEDGEAGAFPNSSPSDGGLEPLGASGTFGHLDDLDLYFRVGAKPTDLPLLRTGSF